MKKKAGWAMAATLGAVLLGGSYGWHHATGGAEAEASTVVAASAHHAFTQRGRASWYGPGFHGKLTASGDRYDQNRLTAAHRTLPLGSTVTVTNLENGKSVKVVINDRGPYVRGRVIDLSRAAARKLDMLDAGVIDVRVAATDGVQLANAERSGS